MSTELEARHMGFAVCETCDECDWVIVPLVSYYKHRQDSVRAAWDVVCAATGGIEPTSIHLWPVSQMEQAEEALEKAAGDMPGGRGCTVLAYYDVMPGAAVRERAELEARRWCNLAGLNAAAVVDELRSQGYPAAYSKGRNVWCNSPKGDRDEILPSIGMRWAGKRCQWYIRVNDAGGEFKTRHVHLDELAAQAA